MKLLSIILGLLVLTGCSHFDRPDDPNFAPVYPAYQEPIEPQEGSLYQANIGLSLYGNIVARRVGDIITVVLAEKTDASKSGMAKYDKESTASIANPTVFSAKPDFGLSKVLPIPLNTTDNLTLETSLAAERDFDGSSEAEQNNNLSGTITVSVMKVYPNGNLYVKGEKWLTINHGDEYIRLSGIIRPEDIDPDNTITSNRLADARISYSGTGSLQNASKPGWLSRMITHWLFPL